MSKAVLVCVLCVNNSTSEIRYDTICKHDTLNVILRALQILQKLDNLNQFIS